MKVAPLVLALLAGGIFSTALAQAPQETKAQRVSMSSYRDTPTGKQLDFVITGSSVNNLVVQQFELKSFHNGDPRQIQIIAQAPQCQINQAITMASDAGPLQVFTPTTNLFVQGVGFVFAQSNHFLIISNQVETRVVKSLLRSPELSASRTNAATDAGQVLKIFANQGRFNLESNIVDYAGNVHMIDPQLDMTCDLLTIRLTTNGAVESILARQNVVLTTTNSGRATGDTGLYFVTNGNEMMQLTTNAKWRNGDEAAKANEFNYDSTRHLLTGTGHVWVQWPNSEATPSNRAGNSTALLADTNGFREMFADFATLQFPPTNGPVQSMHARGHVIIINQADQSSAMAERAEYEKASDSVTLTGNPVWWNTNMEVKAGTLTAELDGKTYHARTNAHFKMRTGGAATNNPAAASSHSTNQWLFITSDDMEYHTNLAVFSQNAEARLVENDRLQDTLDCVLLTVNLTNNQVESAFASGQVHAVTAPDAAGVVKTIACQQLNAYRSIRTGFMKTIEAYTNVVIEENGNRPGAPHNRLMADTVTAQFSAVTNQIEQAVAEQNVALDQRKAGHVTRATSEHAVYTAAADQVKLTGTPLAHTESYDITQADFMIWQPKANTFQAVGPYKIVPIRQAAAQR